MACGYVNDSSSSESEDGTFDLHSNKLRPYAFEPLVNTDQQSSTEENTGKYKMAYGLLDEVEPQVGVPAEDVKLWNLKKKANVVKKAMRFLKIIVEGRCA